MTLIELQAPVLALGSGIWLGAAQSFEHSSGPIYRYMRTFDEWIWSGALVLAVLLWLAGTVAPVRWLRCLGLMMIGCVWLLMAGCFVAGNPYAFTTFTYLVLAFSAGYSSVRLLP